MRSIIEATKNLYKKNRAVRWLFDALTVLAFFALIAICHAFISLFALPTL